MPRSKHIINVHTGTGTTQPSGADLYLGEIAVQHTPNDPALWIKVGTGETSTEYEKFIGETEITNIINDSKILGSAYTYTGISYVNSATTIADAYSALTNEVIRNEGVVAAAFNDLNIRVDSLSGSSLTGVSFNGVDATVSGGVAEIDYHELPEVTSADEGKVLKVVDSTWCAATNSIIYAGPSEPLTSLGNNGDVYFQTNPVVLYETDGTTGLLGHNQNSFANQWQLENLDLTPYRYIKCYFKASDTTDGDIYTPAVVVTVPLDDAAMGPTAYMGGVQVSLPFNRNREYMVTCAVDGTKTKFQVVHQNTLWDITASDANNNGRYLYKIEGYV